MVSRLWCVLLACATVVSVEGTLVAISSYIGYVANPADGMLVVEETTGAYKVLLSLPANFGLVNPGCLALLPAASVAAVVSVVTSQYGPPQYCLTYLGYGPSPSIQQSFCSESSQLLSVASNAATSQLFLTSYAPGQDQVQLLYEAVYNPANVTFDPQPRLEFPASGSLVATSSSQSLLFLVVVGPRALGTVPTWSLSVVDTGTWEVRANSTTSLTIVSMAYDEEGDRLFAWVFGESMPVQTSLVLLDPATATAVTTYAPSLFLTPLTMTLVQGVVYSCMDLSYSNSGGSLVGCAYLHLRGGGAVGVRQGRSESGDCMLSHNLRGACPWGQVSAPFG